MKHNILTEAGDGFGFGHLSRSIAMYQGFIRKGYKPIIFLDYRGEINAIQDYLLNFDIVIINWKLWFLSGQTELNGSYFVIDSYDFSIDSFNRLSMYSSRFLVFDDLNVFESKNNILVARPSLLCSDPNEKKYLGGIKFVPLNENVIQMTKIKKFTTDNLKEVLIVLGSGVSSEVYQQLINLIDEFNFVRKIKIVTKTKIQSKLISRNTLELKSNLNHKEFLVEIGQAGLVICSAGQIIYEVIMTGVTFIPVLTASNQMNNYLSLIEMNYVDEMITISNFQSIFLMRKTLIDLVATFDEKYPNQIPESLDISGTDRLLEALIYE